MDQEVLQVAMSDAITAAVKDALGGYDVHKIVREKVQTSILQTSIDSVVTDAVDALNAEGLTKAVTAEIERTVTSMTAHVLRDAMVSVMVELRKPNNYMTDNEKKILRAEIVAEMKRG